MENNNYYVYFWKRKSDDFVFHIGLGHGKRMYDLKKRNKYFIRFYKKYDCYVEKYLDGLTKTQAAKYEKELIEYYKNKNQATTNLPEGGCGGNTLKYMSKKDLKEFKAKISIDSKNKWKNQTIRNNIVSAIREKMKTKEVKEKISKRTIIAMSKPEIRQKLLYSNARKVIFTKNNKDIEFESLTKFANYLYDEFGIRKGFVKRLKNGVLYIKKQDKYYTNKLNIVGCTITKLYKDEKICVSTICDECSRVEKK